MEQWNALDIYLKMVLELIKRMKFYLNSFWYFFLNKRTPLYMACISGFGNVVDFLLESGANPNQYDIHYWTPLHRASLWSHILIIQSLLAKGADPNATDEDGWSPLHLVAKWDHFEAAEYLIHGGANPNQVNNDGSFYN